MKLQKFDLERLIRPNIKTLKPYSSARDEFNAELELMTLLDANENPFKTNVNRYPDPQQREVKTILGLEKDITPECILLGNGSDEILDLIFRAFCNPGIDNIITVPPTYGMYKVLAGINDIENREVLLDTNFNIRTKAILDTVDTQTKLIFICSPNNPTGNSIAVENITFLLENYSGIVVIDEAYIDFTREESWITKLRSYPNLIVTQTFSKAYGMAGIRLGMCFASCKIIEVLHKIKPPYNVNELTQQKALHRLQDMDVIQKEVTLIMEEREQLIKVLKSIPYIEKVYPTEANFILVKVDNVTRRYTALLKKGIVVRKRDTQPLCEGTLRFTVGTPDENELLIKTLKELT